MKILAIDFSSSLRSVALAVANGGSVRVLGRAEERHGQSTHAFAMIADVLNQAGLARDAIDRLAIGLGPGSYAGIRVSLAIAQGWQLASGVSTMGISSVAGLAATAWSQGHRGSVAFAVDAQRGEYYLADYQLTDAGCQELRPLEIVARSQLDVRLARGVPVFGPDVTASFPAASDLFPAAGVLATLAAARDDLIRADQLEPIYLRAASFVKAPTPAAHF